MKKLAPVISAAIGGGALLFGACQDFFELGEETITPKGIEKLSATTIQFDNRNSTAGAIIFDDSSRSETSGITSVDAGQLSKKLDWQPVQSNFYVSYDISIAGIPIVYVPSNGIFQALVSPNANTEILVPPITEYAATPTEMLVTNKYYVSIHNAGSSGYTLMKGSTVVKDTANKEMINAGRTGVYEIKDRGDYKVSYTGGIEYPLTSTIMPEYGYVYVLAIDNDGLTCSNTVLINRENTSNSTQPSVPNPDTGSGYTVLKANEWESGSVYSGKNETYRFSVQAGKSYYIQWNDEYNGDKTTTADVKVSAYFSIEPNLTANRQITLFIDEDNGWTQARPITAQSSGYVFVVVRGYYESSSGTYAIRYYTN